MPANRADPAQLADRVVDTFMPDGVLTRMPGKMAKRRIVLERVAQLFEPGARYTERQVDAILHRVTDAGEADHVSVRRYLVDLGLMSREDGVYWRSGGWVAGS